MGMYLYKLSTANGLVPLKRIENILLDSKVDYQPLQLDGQIYLTEINVIRDTQAAAKQFSDPQLFSLLWNQLHPRQGTKMDLSAFLLSTVRPLTSHTLLEALSLILSNEIDSGLITIQPWSPQFSSKGYILIKSAELKNTGLTCNLCTTGMTKHLLSPFCLVEYTNKLQEYIQEDDGTLPLKNL